MLIVETVSSSLGAERTDQLSVKCLQRENLELEKVFPYLINHVNSFSKKAKKTPT